ncbi:MAG: hypothetical protein QOE35_840 [Actinomycetota bacterium]|jgi:hypothetical protein
MTEYLLAVHGVEGQENYPSDEDMQAAFKAVAELNTELQAKGAWVFGGGLQPPTSATVVQVQDGEVLLTDGPFAEAKEQLGGFWVINAADLDEALAWAAKATVACAQPVEVRPFQGEPEA